MLSGVAAAFDRIGEAYDAAFGDREAQRGWGRELLTRLPAGGRVLGHGCGSGSPTAVQLAEAGLEVVGVDESERMLELARLRVPSGRFERRDLRALGPELGSFDAVASFFALLMLPCADIPLVLAGLAARLRTGGLLALGMVAGDLDSAEIDFLGVPIAVSAYPTDELVALVTGAGFDVLARREVQVPTAVGTEESSSCSLGWPAECTHHVRHVEFDMSKRHGAPSPRRRSGDAP